MIFRGYNYFNWNTVVQGLIFTSDVRNLTPLSAKQSQWRRTEEALALGQQSVMTSVFITPLEFPEPWTGSFEIILRKNSTI